MNKSELIDAVAAKAGVFKKDAGDVLDALVEAISGELANGGSVQLVGFGTFKVSERAERVGRNPKTGEEIKIPATKLPKFVPSKALKEAVDK